MSSTATLHFQGGSPGIVPASPVVRPPSPAATGASNDAQVASAPAPEPEATSTLEQAVDRLNRYVAGSRTDLQFRIDEEAGRVVVSIVDSDSGRVLRQMPSEDALRIARYLDGGGGAGLVRQHA